MMRKTTWMNWGLLKLGILAVTGLLMASRASGQSPFAILEGRMTDLEGNALAGAAVSLRCVDTGYEYRCLSRPDGRYIIAGIEPGNYEVRAGRSGFPAQTQSGLVFNVGTNLKIDFRLSAEILREEIIVTASPPLVEVTKSEISSVIDRRKIDDLPLLDRDYASLTYTRPGIQESGSASSNAQPLGSEEMLVDGVSGEWVARNMVRTQLPADAIEEFRVMTNQYQAEFGNSSGMIRTAITRTGSNNLRGRVSFFSRDEAFDQVNYFINHKEYQGAELPKGQWQKPPYEHFQFGGFVGGPIKRDKAHFFLAYDGLRRTDYSTITSPLVPKETVAVGTKNDLTLLKLSFQLNERHLVTARLSRNWLGNTNEGVGGFATKERAYDYRGDIAEFQANWTFFLSSGALNELRLHYVQTVLDYTVRTPGSYTVNRPSGGFGKPMAMPQRSDERRYQLVDNFSVNLGNHSLKFGLDFSTIPMRLHIETLIPGLFAFTTDKPFDPADQRTYPLYFYYNSTGFADNSFSYGELGIFAQDTWISITPTSGISTPGWD